MLSYYYITNATYTTNACYNTSISYTRREMKKKQNKTSETISDSAEGYAGLSIRFESSATLM